METNHDIKIVGELEAIFFENPSNLYKVVKVMIDLEASDQVPWPEVVMTGQFGNLQYDTAYEFYGRITHHPKYGEQFAVNRYQQLTPTSREGLVEYLSSDRFKGVGSVLAERMVDTLGLGLIDAILEDSKHLDQVTGLSQKVKQGIVQQLQANQGIERIFVQLSQWGISTKLADRIYQRFQADTLEILKTNPYQLLQIEGIGFFKADQLGEQLEIAPDHPDRVAAGIYAAVSEHCLQEGDTYLPQEEALLAGRQLLEQSRPYMIADEFLQQGLEQALAHELLFCYQDRLMIPSLYYAELGTVKRLIEYQLYEDVDRFSEAEIDAQLDEAVKLTGVDYDETQRAALKLAIQSPMSIITGGPGTGKTTLIQGLIVLHSLLHDYDYLDASRHPDRSPILLAAPTGRAAKRMQEATEIPAATIHRLLGFTRLSTMQDFVADELDGLLLIVDEMSMVDSWLMNWLMQAVSYHLQVVFVGDRDQLPSVGPGKVFEDLIQSGFLPTIELEQIYRQAQDSSIIELAHAILRGHLPTDFLARRSDRTFIEARADQVPQAIEQIVGLALSKDYDLSQLQVLAPMYKGPAGINRLNDLLQALINPPKPGRRQLDYFERVFRVGDKVLHLVNNAEEDVYNGDIGRIEAIFYKNETQSKVDELVVSYDQTELTYQRSDLDQLTLAYCTSIHKAQGSEFALVILPLVDMYSRLLRKDLIYTAVTRAQQSLVMLGNPASFDKAVSQPVPPRRTNLADWLVDYQPETKKEPVDNELVQHSTTEHRLEVQGSEPSTLIADDVSSATSLEASILTMANYLTIDPMIGMEGVSPADFMS